MIVYRLTRSAFANELSGKGAELNGGRWNNKGTSVIYTSASRALCTAEIAVHIPLGIMPEGFKLVSIELPDHSIFELDTKSLPKEWRNFPHPDSTQKIGDSFIRENKYLVLKVPSAVVQGDFNFLINPSHKDFGKVKIKETESFSFDERLFRKRF